MAACRKWRGLPLLIRHPLTAARIAGLGFTLMSKLALNSFGKVGHVLDGIHDGRFGVLVAI
jgi:hypothetical protein